MTDEERTWLERIGRSPSEPASHVARAKQILSVANRHFYQGAAFLSGRKSGDAVSNLVKRFNQEGLNAIQPRHGGGSPIKYGKSGKKAYRCPSGFPKNFPLYECF